jgi:hypothetical protein
MTDVYFTGAYPFGPKGVDNYWVTIEDGERKTYSFDDHCGVKIARARNLRAAALAVREAGDEVRAIAALENARLAATAPVDRDTILDDFEYDSEELFAAGIASHNDRFYGRVDGTR